MKTQILEMMKHDRMSSNATCNQCQTACRAAGSSLTNALGPWIVCDKHFAADSVLFVGKVARGDTLGGELIADDIEDVTEFGIRSIASNQSAYWAYTRAIIERVFGNLETGVKRVSFTNMVKCNDNDSGTTQDKTDYATREFCIEKNRFIWKELEIIRPRLVILYTNSLYDDYIARYLPRYAHSFKDNEKSHMVDIGEKTMPWWDRSYYDEIGRAHV